MLASIQLPHNSSTTPTLTNFGTKAIVGSWSCVADWIMPTSRPTDSAVSRIGAPSFGRQHQRVGAEFDDIGVFHGSSVLD